MGTDLSSPEHNQTVAFRNGSFITPKYTVMGTKIYDTKTGILITDASEEISAEVEALRTGVERQLNLSDSIINSDLLRFYTPENFTPVDSTIFNYKNQVEQLKEAVKKLDGKNTNLISHRDGQTTVELYKTDAPERMVNYEGK